MGIESDQLVYDYLSRVGDVAQQRQLPSGERMRLVAGLRGEIDRQRGTFGGDSPAAVRRILGRLGSPDDVVGAAADGNSGFTGGSGSAGGFGSGGGSGSAGGGSPAGSWSLGGEEPGAGPPPPSGPALPKQRARRGRGRGLGLGLGGGASLPKQTRGSAPEPSAPPTASPPHLAPTHELGVSGSEPDWWRVDPGPLGTATGVSGFVGGVEIPEILKPPPTPEELAEKARLAKEAEAAAAAPEPVEKTEPGGLLPRLLPRLPRRTKKSAPSAPAVVVAPAEKARPGFQLTNPFLLLAAGLLVVGAILGSWLALAGGWVLAYASRRLSPFEAKLAVFGLPIVTVAGAGLWLWGRTTGRWGEPIPAGAMGDSITEALPVVVRVAAVSSALFLVWRSRRR